MKLVTLPPEFGNSVNPALVEAIAVSPMTADKKARVVVKMASMRELPADFKTTADAQAAFNKILADLAAG